VTKGVIILAGKKKDTLQVRFQTDKGKEVTKTVPQVEISAGLQRALADEKSRRELEGKEVVLEVDKGEPRRVRLPHEPVSAAQASSQGQSAQASGIAGRPQSPPRTQPSTTAAGAHGVSQRRKHFHNPYNFVPAPPRDTQHPELGDHEPPGHHRFERGRYSGVIRVRMRCESPLLVVDAARAEAHREDPQHKIYPVRLDAEGKPYVAPTSVKGMLRAAYEAVTNSRLAVFEGWDRRLAMRRAARVDVVPVRVVSVAPGALDLAVLSQVWLKAPAKLPRYASMAAGDRRKGEAKAALRYPDGTLPQHMDHVWVTVDAKGYVTRIRKWQDPVGAGEWHEGWVYITNANIKNKRCERVFVVSKQDRTIRLKGDDANRVSKLWQDLIRDYQEIHKKDLEARRQKKQQPQDYLGDEPGKTAWSRHVYERDAVDLGKWGFCYASLNGDRIDGLYPVAISRQLFKVTPLELLPANLRPATRMQDLSPADRVFGWVNQQGAGAWKGLLRVGPVECVTADAVESFTHPGLPLAVLGQPKPQQSRFYVAKDKLGNAQEAGLPKEAAGYASGKGLRGRKVYPHQRLSQGHWQDPNQDRTQELRSGVYQEYYRPKSQRDSQNRSLLGWVRPGSEFQFDLHVMNLSEVELGALLWLLSLPEGHFHRLGGGKPLGFGSVRLEIDWNQTCLADGDAWQQFYGRLYAQSPCAASQTQPTGAPSAPKFISAFEHAVSSCYGSGRPLKQIRFIAAFLRAAKGFDDGLPVHYPRVGDPNQQHAPPPSPDGEGYEWFVANERVSKQQCEGLALPDLDTDAGLPVLARQEDRPGKGQKGAPPKGGPKPGGGKRFGGPRR
jgi:CRISPR-associated protein (TIGR03986 family)